MVKDTLNSLKGVLYERISSPLWGTYFVAWLLYNWEVVLIFMTEPSPTHNRSELIKAYLYSKDSFNYGLVFWPLSIAIISLALVPVFQALYFVYSEFIKMKGKVRRDEFESKTRLTIEQSNDLRKRIMNISASGQEITSFQDQEINSLKESIKNLQSTLNSTEPNEELELITQQLSEMKKNNAEISAILSKVQAQEIKNKINFKVDAVDIETAFARITGEEIGARGEAHDADIFRHGSISDISKALDSAIEAINLRLLKLNWNNLDYEAGEIGAQTEVAMSRLKNIIEKMKNHERLEPNDYHWSIVANLFVVINTLLVIAERNQSMNKNEVIDSVNTNKAANAKKAAKILDEINLGVKDAILSESVTAKEKRDAKSISAKEKISAASVTAKEKRDAKSISAKEKISAASVSAKEKISAASVSAKRSE
tara:strand:+ start:1328 stop:2608 length:1281 start_codon:yes stop_codon:yes gene_type:complete